MIPTAQRCRHCLLLTSMFTLMSCTLPPLEPENGPPMPANYVEPVQREEKVNVPVKWSAIPVAPVPQEKSPEERIDELEVEVTALRQELNLIRPSLQKAMADKTPVKKTSPAPQAPKPAPPVAVETYQGPPMLASVRAGEHPGRTRLVLDVGRETPFSYDLDNFEKILMINLPEAAHGKELRGVLQSSPFVAAYQSQPTETGSRLFVQLRQPVKILKADNIRATAENGARIFFDITGM